MEDVTPDGRRAPGPFAALCCALAYMRRRCEQLNGALACSNAAIAETLVQDCVQYWLVATAALRRLERSKKEELDAHGETARLVVSRTAGELMALLDRGVAALPEPTRSSFTHLRITVKLAISALEQPGPRRDHDAALAP